MRTRYNFACLRNYGANLMRHAIEDVIEPHPKRHRCKLLWIIRVVGPLPCVAQMHVMTDGDHDMSFVVADSTPFWLITILFVSASGANPLLASNLHFVIDVIERMEDFVTALEVLYRTIRQDLSHAIHKVFPILGSVKIIHHQKSTFEQILA